MRPPAGGGRSAALTAIALAVSGSAAATPAVAQIDRLVLELEAPASLSHAAAEIRGLDTSRLERVMRLAGLSSPGNPIRVLLVAEGSGMARAAPPWVAGFANAERDLVVLFPSRIGPYPDASLEALLHHEVAHVLISRAAGGRPVPRWFNEGLATASEPARGLQDFSRFAWELARGGRVSLENLDRLFSGRRRDTARAYTISNALVRDLLETYGRAAPGRILERVAAGTPFDRAFLETTGVPPSAVAETLWLDHQLWVRWIPLVTGPFTLWMSMTLLALLAIWKHRRKRAERLRRWEEDEEADAWARRHDAPPGSPGDTVH